MKKPKKAKKIRKVYMAGSMEGRSYESLFYEHYYVRQQLVNLGLEVFDPLLKEDHVPGKTVGLKGCGLAPLKVYKQDLGAVEKADIVFWITGDIQSEGSVCEVAWAGCMNKFIKKPFKEIVIVSPRRHKSMPKAKRLIHFSSMHNGAFVVKSVDDGIQYIKKKFSL